MTNEQANNYILFLLVVGYAGIYALGYLLTKRETKIDKKLFSILTLSPYAIAFIDYNFISPIVADGWVPVYYTLAIIFYFVLTPLMSAHAAVGRAQEAGKPKQVALLLIVPAIALFAWLYLLFQEPEYNLQPPGH